MLERNVLVARRIWPLMLSGLFEPIFYLLSISVGIGGLVGAVRGPTGALIPYTTFVAPALLAASAMNGAVYESTFNLYFKLKYAKIYDAVLATPLEPLDVALGDIGFALLRGAAYGTAFLGVMVAGGLVQSWWAVLVVPAVLLIGFGFAGMGMAATTYMRSWTDFDLVILATMPLFLFSATFYPLSTYPPALRWVVQVTPLYQGVDLMRSLTLGDVRWTLLVRIAYLAGAGFIGLRVVARRLDLLLKP
ncbi:MAG: ABC transporter permease [Actinobacteria bacterium]|nr:ABC transporter permease [Actinomycetota bacterium]